MPSTISGIVTLVSPVQYSNARHPMLVTGQFPSVEGMTMSPEAGDTPCIFAFPSFTA